MLAALELPDVPFHMLLSNHTATALQDVITQRRTSFAQAASRKQTPLRRCRYRRLTPSRAVAQTDGEIGDLFADMRRETKSSHRQEATPKRHDASGHAGHDLR